MKHAENSTDLEKIIQDLFAEIRYIAYQIDALANALKALLPEGK